jgi:hypothetical protein
MANTIEAILLDCISQALSLPRDPVQTDIRDLALCTFNEQGRIIWDKWPWDNEKMPTQTITPDTDGIVTFGATVDVVRAIRGYNAGQTTGNRLFNEDDLIAAANGLDVTSDRFQYMAEEDNCMRIRVNTDDGYATYQALCLSRWVDAVVDDDYDPADPTATPTDYRVLTFAIYRAEPALRAYIKDALRVEFQGRQALGNAKELLQTALQRDTYDADRERRVNPRAPQFTEIGDWL